jgi:hypothetical protein
MGYNTTILVLNDALDVLEDNPKEFVEGMVSAIQEGRTRSIPVGNHCNPVQVMHTAHADVPRLYFSQANFMTELNSYELEHTYFNYPEELWKRLERAKYLLKEYEKKLKEKYPKEKKKSKKA